MEKLTPCPYRRRSIALIKKSDKRYKHYSAFKKKHGFSPSECWSLKTEIAYFLLPRIEHFAKHKAGYPANITNQEWTRILNHIAWSLSAVIMEDDGSFSSFQFNNFDVEQNEFYWNFVQVGIDYLHEYFWDLWD